MKKTLLLLASAALLLVGCAKEQIVDLQEGGLTNVTFTANLDNGVATKASADNDGKGTYVNRCIMEIYFQNQLYKRMEAAMSGTPATATFSNVPVVAGKEYQILFWADHVDVVNTEAGLATDKYYTTKTTTDNKGLKAVTVNMTNFIDALKAKKNDELDAFFAASNYTVSQQAGGNSFTVKLHRPFAQLNVITTDVADGKTVTCADLLPEKVSVSYTAATTFNVADSTVTGSATYAYEAPVYGDKTNWETVKTRGEFTLSMDYILASTEQGAVDVTFITKNGGQAVMTHNLTNLPYQRNYRTNVKGDLLTVGGTWKATIDPIWAQPDIVKVVEVADIKSANEIINQYASSTDNLEVKFVGVPNDSGIPSGDASSEFRAILTSPLKQDANLGIEVMTNTKTLYVGDYKVEYSVAELAETASLKAATVNINVPQNSGIEKLVINAPSKTVLVNGKLVESVGSITNIDAITSQNTLIIEKGQQVGTLTIRQGGLEIHGTVGQAVVPEGHGTIVVRDCENLKETEVYDVLKAYIAEGYVGVKGRTTADLWDIVPEVCKIGTKSYGTLIDAVAAVQSGETINLVRDYEGDGVVVPGGKNFTLDFGGHTYKVIGNMAGSAGTQNQCFQLLKGSTLVFQNGTITTSCAKLGINTYSDVTIKNVTIDMSQTEATGQVACLETCNGTVSVEGESNLITKEDQIATLVLYWPNGGYGDINLTMNTTGEVNGLMAYGSYQVQDLSTVAQHSHVAIKNGKYDAAFDMDNLDNYDYKISGGVFSEKPDASLIAEHFDAVANTDPATSAKYPYTVKVKPVVKIGNVEYADIADAFAAVPANTPTTVTLLENIGSKVENEIVWKEYNRTFAYTVNANQNITFDLNGKKIYAKTTVNGYTGFFLVKNGGSLTIKDSAEGGELNYLDGKDNEGGLAISSEGKLVIESGTIANYTTCTQSAIQGAIDVHANEWGTKYAHHVTFTMNGGVLKSQADNTLRIYDSSQTGTGGVVIDFEINGGEIYGNDAVFIMPAWTGNAPQYSTGETYMNNINVSVKGGKFDTNNGIRVYQTTGQNNKEYKAININVTSGDFTIHNNTKYRVNHVAFQSGDSTESATAGIRSYTDVTWTAKDPTYLTPVQK